MVNDSDSGSSSGWSSDENPGISISESSSETENNRRESGSERSGVGKKKVIKKKTKKRAGKRTVEKELSDTDVETSDKDRKKKKKKKEKASDQIESSALDTSGLISFDVSNKGHDLDRSLMTTTATTTATTSTIKQINNIDFGSSNQTSGWDDFQTAPPSKNLFFQLKAGGDEYSITIQKKDLPSLFDRIAGQMGLPKAKELKLLYPLKLADGGEKILTLKYSKVGSIFRESLQQFYIQAVPHSTIAVTTETVQRKRPDRPHEINFDSYFQKYARVDKRFYEEMITPSIAEAFLQKTKFVRVLLGTNWCVNLVSPGHYLCHVQGCGNLVKLKDFNDHTRIILHIKDHVHTLNKKKTKFPDDKSCVVLLRRLKVLKSQKHLVYSRTVDKSIDDLESRKSKSPKPNDPEFPYAIKHLMKNKVLVKTGDNFKGRIYHTPLDVMEKLANHDPTALDGVPEASTIGSMLGGRQ